jgi:putative tryptophan/tyrosine transport system substrate-binding protein
MDMRRRDFISLIGGATVAWPLAAHAQSKSKTTRRVAALMPYSANDPQSQNRNAAFLQALQQFGWIVGQNVQIDYRWSEGKEDDTRKYAAELVALAPDVIFVAGSAGVEPLRRATRTVPIVFALVPDPIGAGFVDSLARPGGNITGFSQYDYNIATKWLALLKEIAPNTTRAAVLRDPAITAGIGQWATIQSVSSTVGIEVSPISLGDAGEMESALTAFARNPNVGLIVTGAALTIVRRDLIIALAARYRLPAVYYDRYFISAGGLISYGSNNVELFRLAAGYVDRILKGDKPADLPVQTASKYELVINLKTARALGITIPASVLARADDVIE